MKIAIDLRPLQSGHEFRGIGSYLSNVLRHFPFGDNNSYVFIRYDSDNPVKTLGLDIEIFDEIVLKRRPEKENIFNKLFKKNYDFRHLDKYKVDVFFQPDQGLGFPKNKKIKKVVVVYDLIPLVLRDYYLPDWKKILSRPGMSRKSKPRRALKAWLNYRIYLKGVKNIKKADKVICISNSTQEDLIKFFGIPKHKIYITPLAGLGEETLSHSGLKPKLFKDTEGDFLLFIGGVDERRRLADLVQAFNLFNARERGVELVLVGKELENVELIPNVEARNAIMSSSYRNRVHLMGFVKEEEKTWMLKHAFAFVYPSLYEGFGIPVLEALQNECPVVAYKNSSLLEVSDTSAILLDTEEQNGLGLYKALKSLKNEKLRKKLGSNGKKQSKKFSWRQCALETYNVITS